MTMTPIETEGKDDRAKESQLSMMMMAEMVYFPPSQKTHTYTLAPEKRASASEWIPPIRTTEMLNKMMESSNERWHRNGVH